MTRINTWIMAFVALAASVSSESATLTSLEVAENSVTFHSDAAIDRVEHFVMSDPNRLVVDLYGVSQEDAPPPRRLGDGFRRLRSGVHPDKIRFVFEAAGDQMPSFSIDQAARGVTVSWRVATGQAAARPQPPDRDQGPRVTAIEILDAADPGSSGRLTSGVLAPIARIWRHQVRITVQPFGELKQLKHFLGEKPDRLVLELVGATPGDHGRQFSLRDGFRQLQVDATQQQVRLVFEMGDGPLPGFDIIEAPSQQCIVVAWGALGEMPEPTAAGARP